MSSKRNVKIKTYNPQTRSKNRKRAAYAVIAVVLIAIVAAVLITQTGLLNAGSPQSTPSPAPTASSSPTPSSNGPYPSVTTLTSPAGEYSASSTKILFITSQGNIVLQLRNDKPITTVNFIKLVEEGYYNNTIFQRVLAPSTPGQLAMIQGGQGAITASTIKTEIGSDNHNYNMTIAMANTGQPDSASSQFFINVADNNNLVYQDGAHFDALYAVFGQVIYGQGTVMKISEAPVEASMQYNGEVSQPVTPVHLIGAVVMP